mmetsp:Transcript_3804/g.4376  ORF Transcript_3804/g.4376 Transcript_3804/m.4376 type:complete len:406 (-) Transcript_3804:91-1308(-)
MPWLKRGEVLFIHVPRCGGTSITKFHKVGPKSQEGHNIYHRIGIKYYYYRYKLLEQSNFPFLTIENCIVLFEVILATFLYFFLPPDIPAPYIMWTTATTLFLTSTFVWTAPITMRIRFFRYFLMFFQDKILCKFGQDTRYLIGTNIKGYLFHLTGERCLRYGYVTEEEMAKCSFSIVRNPYSRAVSLYEYNKRFFESFEHFIRAFHKDCMVKFHGKGQTDSKDIYCHVLPMYAYTHMNGRQLVNTIIKQEQLKRLVATNWEGSNVPVSIQKALTGIPHANRRVRKVAWQQYYTQETMDLVLEMYEKDFDTFGYDKAIPNRTDLVPRVKVEVNSSGPADFESGLKADISMRNIGKTHTPVNTSKRVTIAGESTEEEQYYHSPTQTEENSEFVSKKIESNSFVLSNQ